MKANGAPKKIYLQVCGDCNVNDCGNCKFEDLEDNVTWWKDKIFDKDVEYIRTDAFIEKARKWFNSKNGIIVTDTKAFFEDFINYIEGE